MIYDNLTAFYLGTNKSLEEMDRDFLTFENLDQYDRTALSANDEWRTAFGCRVRS